MDAVSKTHFFIQPNIRVQKDMEGFGISVLEANLAGLFVIASGIECLCDAIVHGKNGYLVETENPRLYRDEIANLLENSHPHENARNSSPEFLSENLPLVRYFKKIPQ